jgi:large subunit ribosomal protein L30
MTKKLFAIRIRGSVNVNHKIAETLDLIGLKKVNNGVILDDRNSTLGMLQIVKDYITWGEVEPDELSMILKNRGEVVGKDKLSDDYIKKNSSFKSIYEFSKALHESKAELNDVSGLKTIFRMHPPRKGHKGIKRAFSVGGSLGNRDKGIKDLIHKMR